MICAIDEHAALWELWGLSHSLGKSRRGDTGTGVGVALKTTIAASVQARVRARVGSEVAVTTTLFMHWMSNVSRMQTDACLVPKCDLENVTVVRFR